LIQHLILSFFQDQQDPIDIPIEERATNKVIWVRPPILDPSKIPRVVINEITDSESDDDYTFAYMGSFTSLVKEVDKVADSEQDETSQDFSDEGSEEN